MNSKRQAKKILKMYAKESYKARIAYIDQFLDEKPPLLLRISYRHMLKQSLMVVLILVLILSLCLLTASALGIRSLKFTFTETPTHTEIVSDVIRYGQSDTQAVFYEPTYVPWGYELVGEDSFGDINYRYDYQNAKGEYLTIEQALAEDFRVSVDNENCIIRDEIIDGMEVKIYDYQDRDEKQYIFQYENTFFLIVGSINDRQAKKIIRGLNLH